MNGLPRFEAGADMAQQLGASRLNAIVDALGGGRKVQSKGMRFSEGSGGTAAVPIVKRYPSRVLPPFWPQFEPATEAEAGNWVAIVSRGIVTEEPDIYHELSDLFDTDGNPTRFGITPGYSIYVVFTVDEYGIIKTGNDEKPRIDIGINDAAVGGTATGNDKIIRHKLALFDVDADNNSAPSMFEAGDNIRHVRGGDLNLFVYARTVTYTDGYVSSLGRSTDYSYVIAIRNGNVMGAWDTDDLAAAALNESVIDFNAKPTRELLDPTVTS